MTDSKTDQESGLPQVAPTERNPPTVQEDVRDAVSIPGSGRFSGGEGTATHSSISVFGESHEQKEPGGPQFIGSQRVDTTRSDLAHKAKLESINSSRYLMQISQTDTDWEGNQ